MQSNHTWWWKDAELQWHTSQVSQNLWEHPKGFRNKQNIFSLNLWKMFNFLISWKSLVQTWQQGWKILFFHIRNRGSMGLMIIMFKWIEWSWPNNMATHGFNDGHHWLSNGLSQVWCHYLTCHVFVHWSMRNKPVIFESEYMGEDFCLSEYIGKYALQNVDYKILLIMIPFNWYFCSVI